MGELGVYGRVQKSRKVKRNWNPNSEQKETKLTKKKGAKFEIDVHGRASGEEKSRRRVGAI